MTLPKEIYVWDEAPGQKDRELNIECDGGRPMPDPISKEPIRAGIYKLVREVEITAEVKETTIKQAVDPLVDQWGPSAVRILR